MQCCLIVAVLGTGSLAHAGQILYTFEGAITSFESVTVSSPVRD
jgi:hypothetical protein